MMSKPIAPKFALVYQGHIANVFQVENFHPAPVMRGEVTRLRQGLPEECQHFAEGAGAAGAEVRTYHVDNLMDASRQNWDPGVGLAMNDRSRVAVFLPKM